MSAICEEQGMKDKERAEKGRRNMEPEIGTIMDGYTGNPLKHGSIYLSHYFLLS